MPLATQNTAFIKDLEGKVIGVNLGFDICTEHECGIQSLKDAFGIDNKKPGYEGRRNTKVPNGLVYQDRGDVILAYVPPMRWAPAPQRVVIPGMRDGLPEGKKLAGAWDDHSFAACTTQEHKEVLSNLYQALQRKNCVITLSGTSNPFANPGLLLLDYRLIPENAKQEAQDKDLAHRAEQETFKRLEKKSKVLPLLERAGKSFFYLGIKRLDENGEPLWWLNPMEQQLYRAGLYTTVQLKQWAKDKGPVLKTGRGV